MLSPVPAPHSQVGLIFPLFFEESWPAWARVTLYSVGLLYSFVAVFLVADTFMCSIDAICSTTRKVRVTGAEGQDETLEVPVWNGAVANMVLMSLGPRTAPEILISIVGIITSNFNADPLGPSLIIGSGAFNLLIITAVSILVVPAGECRRIQAYPVFVVTMFWSLFAYIWLFIILVLSSGSRVEIWEAAVTIAFIPVVTLTTWMAEKGWFDWLSCCSKKVVKTVSI